MRECVWVNAGIVLHAIHRALGAVVSEILGGKAYCLCGILREKMCLESYWRSCSVWNLTGEGVVSEILRKVSCREF